MLVRWFYCKYIDLHFPCSPHEMPETLFLTYPYQPFRLRTIPHLTVTDLWPKPIFILKHIKYFSLIIGPMERSCCVPVKNCWGVLVYSSAKQSHSEWCHWYRAKLGTKTSPGNKYYQWNGFYRSYLCRLGDTTGNRGERGGYFDMAKRGIMKHVVILLMQKWHNITTIYFT